jgi:uncharacterized protein YndB with AHSA1/START domain
MKNGLTAEASIVIDAKPAIVWKAITSPDMIKK